MKGGADYAKRIKKLFGQLKRAHGKEFPDPPENLVEVLILAVLSQNASDRKARGALQRIIDNSVDMNEFRVTSPSDMPSVLGTEFPDSVNRSKALSAVLNEVFNRENCMDLSKVAQKSKRDARAYFESLPGSSPFVAAYVVLWGLGGHAIPVDDYLAAVLRKEELVDPTADPAEIQSFLERHISASDGRYYATLIRRYAATKTTKAIKALEVQIAPTSEPPVPEEPAAEKTAKSKTKAEKETKPETKTKKKKKTASKM